jgi:hypothetical protein
MHKVLSLSIPQLNDIPIPLSYTVCTQAVDFYLNDRYKHEREDIVRLSTLDAKVALILSMIDPEEATSLAACKDEQVLADAVMASINDPVARSEFRRVLELSPTKARDEADKRIMGYIREAQSM